MVQLKECIKKKYFNLSAAIKTMCWMAMKHRALMGTHSIWHFPCREKNMRMGAYTLPIIRSQIAKLKNIYIFFNCIVNIDNIAGDIEEIKYSVIINLYCLLKTPTPKDWQCFIINEIDLQTRVVHFVQRNFLPNLDFLN